MKMTVEQYGAAIIAAYEAGFIEGTEHPTGEWGRMRAKEYSHAFWARVRAGLEERTARIKAFAASLPTPPEPQ